MPLENRFEQFTMLISKIYRNIINIKAQEMKEFNLKSTHVSCLYYLFKSDKDLTATDITNICKEDKAAVSRAVDNLQENGYIEISSKTEKKYRAVLKLTAKGKKVGQTVLNKINQILEDASHGLSEKERVNLYNSLNLISDNLQNINNSYNDKIL